MSINYQIKSLQYKMHYYFSLIYRDYVANLDIVLDKKSKEEVIEHLKLFSLQNNNALYFYNRVDNEFHKDYNIKSREGVYALSVVALEMINYSDFKIFSAISDGFLVFVIDDLEYNPVTCTVQKASKEYKISARPWEILLLGNFVKTDFSRQNQLV